jgi:NACalpha-BTF3-like transcription factor
MTGQVVSESAIKEEYAKLAGQSSKSGPHSMKRKVINMGRASTYAKVAAKKVKTEDIKYVNQSDIFMVGWGDEEASAEEEKEDEVDPVHKNIKLLLQRIAKIGEEAAEALQTLK